MILAYKNYIKNATLSANTADTNQTIDNLKIPQLTKGFQFNNNIGNLTMDFGMSTNFKSCIVDIGSMDPNASVVTLKGSNINTDWTNAPYSQVLTRTDSCHYAFIDQTYRYWFLDFVDITQQVKLKIGYIFMGDWLQMPPISNAADLIYDTTSKNSSSISLQQYSDRGIQFVSTGFDFPLIHDEAGQFLGKQVVGRKEILEAWKDSEFQFCWLFVWENSLDSVPPIFGSMTNNTLKFAKLKTGADWKLSFDFKEIK